MGTLKNILEPAFIVSLFTLGCLVNSRGRRPITNDDGTPPEPRWAMPKKGVSWTVLPRLDRHMLTRFLNCFPFFMEVIYWNLTYWIYQLARAYSATQIRDNEAIFSNAERHAIQILDLEKRLHIAIEKPMQDLVLNNFPWLMNIFACIYFSHITLGIAFLVYCFTFMSYRRFSAIRRTLFADNWIAFVILTLWRATPPRLLPYDEFGYLDVLHDAPTGSVWTHNRFQLTIAAMPSLHFGTSLFLAVSIWRFSPHQWLRAICFAWPTMMLVTILVTANHWLLDAAVGACIPLLGWRINQLVNRFQPIEDWFFSAIRTERPVPGESVEVLRREVESSVNSFGP